MITAGKTSNPDEPKTITQVSYYSSYKSIPYIVDGREKYSTSFSFCWAKWKCVSGSDNVPSRWWNVLERNWKVCTQVCISGRQFVCKCER